MVQRKTANHKYVIYSLYSPWARYRSHYNDWLRVGLSGNRIPVGARFSAPVQKNLGAQSAFCTMGTGSFSGVKRGRGVTLTSHPLLVPWSRKGRAILLLPLRAVRPVQTLSACTRVHFTFTLTIYLSCQGTLLNITFSRTLHLHFSRIMITNPRY